MMRRVVCLLLLTVSLGADIWQPALYTEGRAGNYRKGGGALVFAPYGQDCAQLLFGQARAGVFRELYVGTLGCGYRRIESWWAWGVNAFFDVARSNSKRVYYQGGIGAEWFGDCWLFRANGYWPSRNRHTLDSRRTSDVFINGTSIFSTDTMFNNTEQGYHGFDLEVGKGMQVGCGQLWGYAGYYYFDASKATSQQGPRLRLEYTLDDFLAWCPIELTLGGEWERNDRHGSTASGYVSARLPLWTGCNLGRSSSCCDSMCRVLGDPVFRNRAIWVDREVLLGNCATILLPQQIFFFEQGASGAGTQIDPADVTTIQAGTSGPGDILFALPGTAPINLAGAALGMQANQQLYSFGPNGQGVIDLGDGRQLTVPPLPGASANAATIIRSSSGNMINMDANPVINGLIIDGVSLALRGLVGTDPSALRVVDVALQNFIFDSVGGNAIEFDGYATACIERCLIANNVFSGCVAVSSSATNGLTLSLLRTEFTGNAGSVVYGYNDQSNQLIARGCTFTGSAPDSALGVVPVGTGLRDMDLLIDDCQFDNMSTGLENLSTAGGTVAAGGNSASSVLNSRFGTITPLTAIAVEITNPRVAGAVPGRDLIAVARNTLTLLDNQAVISTGYQQGSTGAPSVQQRSLVQENTILVADGIGRRGVSLLSAGSDDVCTTVRNNQITAVGGVSDGILVNSGTTTIDGNLMFLPAGSMGIDLSGAAGSSTNLTTLSSLNNGADVSIGPGFTDTPIPCQLP